MISVIFTRCRISLIIKFLLVRLLRQKKQIVPHILMVVMVQFFNIQKKIYKRNMIGGQFIYMVVVLIQKYMYTTWTYKL